MNQHINFIHKNHSQSFEIALEEIARAGARKMLQQAHENEVEEYLTLSSGARSFCLWNSNLRRVSRI